MKLSLVVPCYNEQDNVQKFYDTVNEAFEGRVEDYELVFVNDGSRDETLKRLKVIYYNKDRKRDVQVISFSRNFGKEAAIYAGLERAKGELICIIDADLQQRPEVVLEMLDIINSDEDTDCVAAYQDERREGKLMSALKSGFYNTINKMSDVDFVNGASDFRLMKRAVAKAVVEMREYHRFSKGMFSFVGFNTRYIPYKAAERESGETKWGTRKLIKYALEGIFAFSTAPLRIPLYTGLIFILLSFAAFVAALLSSAKATALIAALILLCSGVILLSLGIIGEYLAKMYIQGKNRPIYILKEHLDND